jgi:hypothetical protein
MPYSLDGLIRLEEIPTVFSDRAVGEIADEAGLSLGTGRQLEAARKTLAIGVRASVCAYLSAKCRQSPNAVHREIESLARAAERGDWELLIDLLDGLSGEARHLLEHRAANTLQMSELRAYGRQRLLRETGILLREQRLIVTVPTVDDLLDPERRKAACEAIFRLAVTGRGRDWEWSEHEPDIPKDGRRHKPRLLRLNAPEPSRQELRREAERGLFNSLQVDCCNATGRIPPTTASYTAPGPFDRFISACFLLARVPALLKDDYRCGLAVQLRNDNAPVHKRDRLTQRWRGLLNTWCFEYDIVDEVRRLVELGEAKVLRIPVGDDLDAVPVQPAIIGFDEAGTVCFWRPPFGYRTIALQASFREEIMDLAEDLDALNTAERRVSGVGQPLRGKGARRVTRKMPATPPDGLDPTRLDKYSGDTRASTRPAPLDSSAAEKHLPRGVADHCLGTEEAQTSPVVPGHARLTSQDHWYYMGRLPIISR